MAGCWAEIWAVGKDWGFLINKNYSEYLWKLYVSLTGIGLYGFDGGCIGGNIGRLVWYACGLNGVYGVEEAKPFVVRLEVGGKI